MIEIGVLVLGFGGDAGGNGVVSMVMLRLAKTDDG